MRPASSLDLSRYPNVYDAAFSWDRSKEAATFIQVARSVLGHTPSTAVELASGSGPLASLWSRAGIRSYGVDRSASAVSWARESHRGVVPPERWMVGDLRRFRLSESVEMAVVPMDSLGYLVEEREFLDFFHAAHRNVVPGGVLEADLTLYPDHLRPVPIDSTWRVSLRPFGTVEVRWRSRGRAGGSPRRRWETCRIEIRLPGGGRQTFWEARRHVTLGARELRELSLRAGGWEAMRVYSSSAHRRSPHPLRRVSAIEGLAGPRLVTWRRSP